MLNIDTISQIAIFCDLSSLVYSCSTNKQLNNLIKQKQVLKQLAMIYNLPFTKKLKELTKYSTYIDYRLLTVAIYLDDLRLYKYYSTNVNVSIYEYKQGFDIKAIDILKYIIIEQKVNITDILPSVKCLDSTILEKVCEFVKYGNDNLEPQNLYFQCVNVRQFNVLNKYYPSRNYHFTLNILTPTSNLNNLINSMIDNDAKFNLRTGARTYQTRKIIRNADFDLLIKLTKHLTRYITDQDFWKIFMIDLLMEKNVRFIPLIKQIAENITENINIGVSKNSILEYLLCDEAKDIALILMKNGALTNNDMLSYKSKEFNSDCENYVNLKSCDCGNYVNCQCHDYW
jgi:hypothetical protein